MVVDRESLLSRFPGILPRETSSVFYRYIEAHNEELDSFEDDIDEVKASIQIDNATGEDLDALGELFGPVGLRSGRDDQEYRQYLKSVVKAFNSRGTVPDMKRAIGSGLGIEQQDIDSTISIREYFEDLEYTIIMEDWPPHSGTTIETIADLSDPSVTRLRDVEYGIDEETLAISDEVDIAKAAAETLYWAPETGQSTWEKANWSVPAASWGTSSWNTVDWMKD